MIKITSDEQMLVDNNKYLNFQQQERSELIHMTFPELKSLQHPFASMFRN